MKIHSLTSCTFLMSLGLSYTLQAEDIPPHYELLNPESPKHLSVKKAKTQDQQTGAERSYFVVDGEAIIEGDILAFIHSFIFISVLVLSN